jgi:hypothetical protein
MRHRSLTVLSTGGVLIIWLLTPSLRAHTIPVSYLTVVPSEDYIHVELRLNSFELSFFAEIDTNRNRRLDPPELERHEEQIAATVFERVELEAGGRRIEPEVLGITTAADHHLTLRGQYPADVRGRRLIVRCNLVGVTHAGHVTVIKYGAGDQIQSALLEGGESEAEFGPFGSGSFDLKRHVTAKALTWQHLVLVLSMVALANVRRRQVIVAGIFIGGQLLASPLIMLVPTAGSSRWLPMVLLAIALLLLAATLRGREDLEVPTLLLPVAAAGVCSGVFLTAELREYGPTLREWVVFFWMLSVIELALVLACGVLTCRSRQIP